MILKLIIQYLKKQTKKEKLFIIVIFCLVLYGLVISVKFTISEYKRLKEFETKYNALIETKKESNKQIDKHIKKGKITLKKAKNKISAIDKKLKIDEAIIDDIDVDDKYLQRYISKHQKR